MADIWLAVNWAISTANNPNCGYNPIPRQRGLNGPDYDCSQFVCRALYNGGFNIDPNLSTHVMLPALRSCGFTVVGDRSNLNADLTNRWPGDVFLNVQHHTAITVMNGDLAAAHSDYDGRPGDSQGNEIDIKPYSNYGSYGWDYHLRPPLDSYGPDGYQGFQAEWHAKATGGYVSWDNQANVTLTQEAIMNCYSAYLVFSRNGWSPAAASAVLGVCCYESGLNPWRWQGDNILTEAAAWTDSSWSHGYGLNQFTPFNSYGNIAQSRFPSFDPNFYDKVGTPEDGEAQIEFINYACEHGAFFKNPNSYAHYGPYGYMPFGEFKTSQIENFDNLVTQWLYSYSRGVTGAFDKKVRVNSAQQIYQLLYNFSGVLPYAQYPNNGTMPIWMMIRYFS